MVLVDAAFPTRDRIFCIDQRRNHSGSFLSGRPDSDVVSRDAAGSGIPQLKIAFWRDFGFLPMKVAVAKFFAGVITIGGGG
jgi:hypothetical protein